MKQEEAYQIQRGDYFLYHGETVKVTGRSPYNENDYNVVNKNGSKFYAEVEELQPITINDYTLKQAGCEFYKKNGCYYYITFRGFTLYFNEEANSIERISNLDEGLIIEMDIKSFHVLQNALRLFGVEVELKQ